MVLSLTATAAEAIANAGSFLLCRHPKRHILEEPSLWTVFSDKNTFSSTAILA